MNAKNEVPISLQSSVLDRPAVTSLQEFLAQGCRGNWENTGVSFNAVISLNEKNVRGEKCNLYHLLIIPLESCSHGQ